MADTLEPTPLDGAFKNLVTEQIFAEDSFTMVMRAHLITELLINEFYLTFGRLGMPKRDILKIWNSTFRSKVDALFEHELIESRTYEPLVILNSIRNRFAHLPLKLDLADRDQVRFLEAFPPEIRGEVVEHAADLVRRGLQRNFVPFREALSRLYVNLLIRVRHAREEGPQKFPSAETVIKSQANIATNDSPDEVGDDLKA